MINRIKRWLKTNPDDVIAELEIARQLLEDERASSRKLAAALKGLLDNTQSEGAQNFVILLLLERAQKDPEWLDRMVEDDNYRSECVCACRDAVNEIKFTDTRPLLSVVKA